MEKNPTKNSIQKDPAVLNDVAIKRTVTSRVTSVNSNPNLCISPSDTLAMSHGELLRKLGHGWVAMRVQQRDFTSMSNKTRLETFSSIERSRRLLLLLVSICVVLSTKRVMNNRLTYNIIRVSLQ